MPNSLTLKSEWLSPYSTTCYHWHAGKLSHPEPQSPHCSVRNKQDQHRFAARIPWIGAPEGLSQVPGTHFSIWNPSSPPCTWCWYGPEPFVKWEARHPVVWAGTLNFPTTGPLGSSLVSHPCSWQQDPNGKKEAEYDCLVKPENLFAISWGTASPSSLWPSSGPEIEYLYFCLSN